MPVGHPKMYKPEYCETIFKLMCEGALDCEICGDLQVSRDTFYRWLHEYEDFKEAHNLGKERCEAWWTRHMRQCFLDKDDKGFKYCIAIMNNKFGWEKGTKQSDVTTNININNMNVLQHKSRDNLVDYVKMMLQKHSDVIDIPVLEDNTIVVQTDTKLID